MLDELYTSLDLPFYILITLIFSYFYWAKFLNNGKFTSDNKIDDILKITALFFFLLSSILGIIFLCNLFISIFNPTLDLSIIWKYSQVTQIFVILYLSYFILIRPQEQKGKKNLSCILNGIHLIYLFSISLTVASILLSLFFEYNDLIYWELFILIIEIAIFFFCRDISIKIFKHSFNNKFSISFFLVLMLILSFFGIFFFPWFSHEKPIHEKYIIPEVGGTIYLYKSVPIHMEYLNSFMPIIKYIPIYYGDYNFELYGVMGNHFSILVNLSKEQYLQQVIEGFDNIKDPISSGKAIRYFDSIQLNQNMELIKLWFSNSMIDNSEVRTIFLKGYSRLNSSEINFTYSDNINIQPRNSETCVAGVCNFTFSIINSQNLPLHIDTQSLFSLKQYFNNVSECRFTKQSNSSSLTNSTQFTFWSDCNGNSCQLSIFDKEKGESIFDSNTVFDGSTVKLHHISINREFSINFTQVVTC